MTTKAIVKPSRSEPRAAIRRTPGLGARSGRDQASATTSMRKSVARPEPPSGDGRVTKQALLVQLLSRPEGAAIQEMMQAVGWQQHSVRGFLAGALKKNLGLALTSTKTEGELRRYRVAAPRRSR